MSRPPLHDLAHLAYLELLTPEFEQSVWFFTEARGQAWGLQTIASFHTHGTPPVQD